jgi:hypothetical protein
LALSIKKTPVAMKLEEGRYYTFKTVKTITLPDSSENIVLLGPDAKKYLLPLSYYANYSLKEKQEITCKVDKINCSGKVFLEPTHPFYKENEYYSFFIDSVNHSDESQLGKSITFTVLDVFGDHVTGNVDTLDETYKEGSEVKIKIERISKGRIHFSKLSSREPVNDLTEGQIYDFTVKATVKGEEGDEFYIVSDKFNKEHQLPVRYYSHYGFKTGTIFRGRIIRYSSGSQKTIEPENPWYAPGDVVEVTVENIEYNEAENNFIAEVYDNKGFLYLVRMPEKPVNQSLRCSVLKIRKGRPVLIPLDEQ